ncbi:MAG TPA: hypothetical protein VG843_09525 [Rhizomicrobium sp.]|jgi:hypothetical protein|nr:hypothetical protein [Rhizomicrobium sp.]
MIRRGVAILLCAMLGACASRAPSDVSALPPGPPPGEPADLGEMTGQALQASLGKPAFARKDGDAELWRYVGADCQAFFFLYPEGGALRVRHVETLPRPKNAASDPACLNSLRTNAASRPVS